MLPKQIARTVFALCRIYLLLKMAVVSLANFQGVVWGENVIALCEIKKKHFYTKL